MSICVYHNSEFLLKYEMPCIVVKDTNWFWLGFW